LHPSHVGAKAVNIPELEEGQLRKVYPKKKGIPGRSHRLTAVKLSEYVLLFVLLFSQQEKLQVRGSAKQ
jgi:hypothetical protein